MLNDKQLEYFMAIAEAGSFRRAAENIRIAQPALTRQMKMLEQDVGVELFFRGHRGVALTDAGELLLERARFIHRHRDQAYADVVARGTVPTGRVGFGAPSSVANILFQPLAVNYLKKHESVQLNFYEGVGHLQRWLASGEIDLAVLGRTTSPSQGEFIKKELLTEPILLVAAKGVLDARAEIAPMDVIQLPLVLTPAPSQVRTLIDRLADESGIAPRVLVETQSVHAQTDLVAAGLGYALLPYSAITDEQRSISLSSQRVAGWNLHRSLAWRSDRPQTVATTRLIEHVIEEMRRLAQNGAFGDEARLAI